MRSVGLVLCAALAVWGLLLLDVRGERRSEVASRPSDTGQPNERDAEPEAPRADADRPLLARSAPSWPERLLGKLTPAARPAPALAEPTAAASGRDAPTGELGEGELSPEFKELEQQYSYEGRDEAWAEQTERGVRELFKDHPLAAKLAVLNCQSNLCRLVLEDFSPEQVSELLYLPGLRRLAGVGPDSPYSLRAGQFSLYFRRPSQPNTAKVALP